MNFNKFNLITGILFVVGFILIMLNFLTPYLNLAAMSVFLVALIMLTISLYKFCLRKNAERNNIQEEIIMELSLQDGEEQYVPAEKKLTGFKKFREICKIFSPCLTSGLLAVLMLVTLVLTLIKLF